MSDISDVLSVLVDLSTEALYPITSFPNGPSSATDLTVAGAPVVIYPGWPPSSDDLAAALKAGKVHVSVFPKQEERNTTRYREIEQVTKAPTTTLTLTINGQVVTVGGTITVPQNVMLRVNNKQYVYSVKAGDTAALVSQGLAALVAVDVPGTYAPGNTVEVGPRGRIQAARVGGFGTIATEVRRQERLVMISIWANDPILRDKVSAIIDVALAQIRFITMPDGFGARLIYKNSAVIDALQKSTLYRRDLNYSVEYATTTADELAAVIAPSANVKAGFIDLSITA